MSPSHASPTRTSVSSANHQVGSPSHMPKYVPPPTVPSIFPMVEKQSPTKPKLNPIVQGSTVTNIEISDNETLVNSVRQTFEGESTVHPDSDATNNNNNDDGKKSFFYFGMSNGTTNNNTLLTFGANKRPEGAIPTKLPTRGIPVAAGNVSKAKVSRVV